MWFLSALVIVLQCFCEAGILPKYDTNCDALIDHRLAFSELCQHKQYFKDPVPRIIHQIWFGPINESAKSCTEKWKEYSKNFNYYYKLWSEKDWLEIEDLMDSNSYSLFLTLVKQKNYWAASDILRLNLLHQIGGVYIDCDFYPPIYNEKNIDLFSFMNDQGLTLILEHKARNVGSGSAIFCGNGFIASPCRHPVISDAVELIFDNSMHWKKSNKNFNAMYCTGPFFLNRVLTGTYSVLPITLFQELHMTNSNKCPKCTEEDYQGEFCKCEERNLSLRMKANKKT